MPRFPELFAIWKRRPARIQARRRRRSGPPFGRGPGGPRAALGGRERLHLMGGQWDNSRPITFSFAPDGVAWDQGTNNVNAKLNAEFGGTGWQSAGRPGPPDLGRRRRTSNFVEVGDGSYAFNAAGIVAGRLPIRRHPDRRLRPRTTSTIAQTYGPPPNGHDRRRRRRAQHVLQLRPDVAVRLRDGHPPRARPLARPGRVAPAVVGHVFLLQRESGRPSRPTTSRGSSRSTGPGPPTPSSRRAGRPRPRPPST